MSRDLAVKAICSLDRSGYKFQLEAKQLKAGGGRAFLFRGPDGPLWVKVHWRSHMPDHRYWVGVNIQAVHQVDAVAFWFEGEDHAYVVPTAFLKGLLEEVPKSFVTVRKRQWSVDIYADRNSMTLPFWAEPYLLDPYAVSIPQAG